MQQDPGTGTPTWATDGREHEEGPIRLELAVVSYADRPDRCTVYDPECDDIDRMAAWLSADRSLVIDLEGTR